MCYIGFQSISFLSVSHFCRSTFFRTQQQQKSLIAAARSSRGRQNRMAGVPKLVVGRKHEHLLVPSC